MIKKLISILVAVSYFQCIYAQLVSGSAYMKGSYVEVGINGLGGYEGVDTSLSPMPSGMHFRSSYESNPYFGFVANPQMDGWVNYDGDFFTPATSENGWGIEIIDEGGAVDIRACNDRNSEIAVGWPGCTTLSCVDIPGAITSYTYLDGLHSVVWEADYISSVYALHITLEYTLYDTALSYTTSVTINNTGEDIDELYFYRSVDPDNNASINEIFETTNTIVSQPSFADDLAEVKAEQFDPWYSCYSLSTHDSTAKAIYGGFVNHDASAIWTCSSPGPTPYTNTIGANAVEDVAIALAWKMDSVFSFRSVRTLWFDSKFASAGIATIVNEQNEAQAVIYPNPTQDLVHIRSIENLRGIALYSAMGELLFNVPETNTVDLSGYTPGIYFLKLITDEGIHFKRIKKD